MDHLSKIPDSESPHDDLKAYGHFIQNGKYCVIESRRGKGNNEPVELSNFVMKSLYNLDNGTNNSKRIFMIQRHTGEISVIEISSSEMKKETFETILRSIRCTFLGFSDKLNLIFARLMDEESEAIFIDVLGWIPEHEIYAFADSIYSKSNNLLRVNDLGIVTEPTEKKNFYLPAFGVANIKDVGQNGTRLYSFRPGNLNFESWSKYYYESFESNGTVGILFLILSVFRDIVFDQVKFFPFLFLFGEAGTGKTSFVERLLSVFGNDTIGVALNNSTITGLSRIVSTRNNSIFYLKEYTSDTDEKAQDFILTAYDGAGRTTGIKSNDNKTQSIVIKSGIIFDGNNLPVEKSAVFSRMILLNHEKQNFSHEQTIAFDRLKQEAEFGLSNVLIDILKEREFFAKNFKKVYQENLQELKKSDVSNSFTDRMINHVALLLTPAKMLWDRLNFPFDFNEATNQIIERAENQSYLLKRSNAITIFWDSFAYGIRNSEVIEYTDSIDNHKNSDFRIKYDNTGGGIIQIKYPNLHPKYVKYCRMNNIKALDSNSLKSNLTAEGNKSFIPGSQKNRGVAITDKVFGSCYQFAFLKKEKCIEINEVEIIL